MKTCHYIFFDLDGTLTDSAPGILNSVAYALERFGIAVPAREKLIPFIGPPLLESFQKFSGLSAADAARAVGYYREYYPERGIFENSVYPGIPEALDALRRAGLRLVMATSKPEAYALRIAERFSLDAYFDQICGAAMDESRSRKAEVIRYAMDRCGLAEPAQGLMVGDREHDVLGARECGLDCVGVLYGYGSRRELEAAGAALFAETPADIPGAVRATRIDGFHSGGMIQLR